MARVLSLVSGQRLGLQIARGPALAIEVAVLVDTAHKRRVVAADDVAHMGRNVAGGEADAPLVGVVGTGAVDQAHVV